MEAKHQTLSNSSKNQDNITCESNEDKKEPLITPSDAELEKEFNKNKEKFKLLYEVTSQEYKDVIAHINSITPKVINLFTILNVILTLCVAFVSNQNFINFYGNSDKIVKLALLLLISFTFIFLLTAWLFLFGYLKSSKFIKIDLKQESDILKAVYDDQQDINYLYFLLYKNYQQAIETNTNIADATLQSLDTGWTFMKLAFVLICCIGSIVYISSLLLIAS